MKVRVAIPCYDRSVTCETVRCLLVEQGVAASAGVQLDVAFLPGCSLIAHARNQCVRDFIVSDADRLFFLDADVAWQPGELLKLAASDKDFIGGAYRYKQDVEGYPVAHIGGEPDPETGLIPVGVVPGGFMSLSRDVFSRLFGAYRARGQYTFAGQNFFAFFHCPPGDGEDGAFCRDWREIGQTVWLDPALTLTHVDAAGRKYTGCIGEWLKGRNNG